MNVVGAPTLAGSGAQDHCSRYHCAKIGKFIKAENFLLVPAQNGGFGSALR